MFSDPLGLAVGPAGETVNFVRINQDSYSSEYFARAVDLLSEFSFKIRHSTTKAGLKRHNFELVQSIYAVGATPAYTRMVYGVWEHTSADTNGRSMAALSSFMADTAARSKLLNNES